MSHDVCIIYTNSLNKPFTQWSFISQLLYKLKYRETLKERGSRLRYFIPNSECQRYGERWWGLIETSVWWCGWLEQISLLLCYGGSTKKQRVPKKAAVKPNMTSLCRPMRLTLQQYKTRLDYRKPGRPSVPTPHTVHWQMEPLCSDYRSYS